MRIREEYEGYYIRLDTPEERTAIEFLLKALENTYETKSVYGGRLEDGSTITNDGTILGPDGSIRGHLGESDITNK